MEVDERQPVKGSELESDIFTLMTQIFMITQIMSRVWY